MQGNETTLIGEYDVIIVGGGPGGLSAAVYSSRANLSTLILERGMPGGQLLNTGEVENYPAISQMNGPQLANQFYEHALKFGATHKYGDVTRIEKNELDNRFYVYVGDTKYFRSKVVIVATGSNYRKLPAVGADELSGRGISYCAVCDGAFYKDKEIIVVGGGNSAVEEGIYLTQFAKKVHLMVRSNKLKAEPLLINRLKENEKIEVHFNHEVLRVNGVGEGFGRKVGSVLLKNDKKQFTMSVDGIFVYIGMTGNSSCVSELIEVSQEGFIPTNVDMTTKIPGLFAVGDVRDGVLRQVITASNDGSIAGQGAYHYIESIK